MQMVLNNIESVRYFAPELILVGTALFLILYNLITDDRKLLPYFTLAGLAIAFVGTVHLFNQHIDASLFDGMVQLNGFTIFFKFLFLTAAVFTVLFTIAHSRQSVEYYCLLLISTFGMFVLSSASDILMLYVGLETVSISSYLLTAIDKGNRKSSEAGLKYVIYGAMASALMVFGMAYLYGVCGSTSFAVIRDKLMASGMQPVMLMSTVLILAGLGYKIAAVPFHMWCPDVYEGAPTPITAFLSVAPKAAGFAIIIRFFPQTFGPAIGAEKVAMLLAVLSALTMTVGNFGALLQTNLKRLLAYSSIAHAGYILMAVVMISTAGNAAVLLYLAIYLFMNMGAFMVVILVSKAINSEDINDYNGLGARMPYVGVIMAIFLFSLIGLPPLAGFIGKLYIFGEVIRQEWYLLALIGVLNGVVSLYYYARVIKAIFLTQQSRSVSGDPDVYRDALRTPLYPAILLTILALPILVIGLGFYGPLLDIINKALGL